MGERAGEAVYDWVVWDLYGRDADGPHFGPMTEREAIDMVARKPKGYWRQRVSGVAANGDSTSSLDRAIGPETTPLDVEA